MSSDGAGRATHIRRLLETEGDAVRENTQGFNDGRYESVADLESYEDLKSQARAIKEDAIERLPGLVDQVTEAVEANGGTVYVADDAADANRYIETVMDETDADSVVKSKSMTTEELEVNEALEANGREVWETDLGEFVLQMADEAPSHLVAPAIHKSCEDIARLFNGHFDADLESAEELTAFARDYLGDRIVEADVGMTGANFVAADTGTLALVTSEGNARKCATVPDTHIAVAGVEKLVPTVEDFAPFVELIGRSGTGQDITSYISLLAPPVETPTVDFDSANALADGSDEDREFHLVFVDNGRLNMREDDQLRETLYCIRCSACANSCANFQHVGGHAFGGETYTGGIATGWEAGVHGQESAAEFNDLCTGCSRCVEACPVKIDIPWINTVVRDRINRGKDLSNFEWIYDELVPDEEPSGVDLQKRLFGNFELLAKLGSLTAPLSNWVARSAPARAVMERTVGVDRHRTLPSFRRKTLTSWMADRDVEIVDPDRRVVLYPDLYTNHVLVERGKAAIRVLEALGVDVAVPNVPGSGRAPLSQGMISTAREKAESVVERLAPFLDDGRDIIVVEPSDLAMFRREYERLLSAHEYRRLSDGSYELFEYLYGLVEHDESRLDDLRVDEPAVAYHSHCQQRTLGLDAYTTAVLDRLGVDVATSDVECCGMAGSFGYKSEYYELSMAVGDDLREQFTSGKPANQPVVASGTSCTEQLDALLDREARHPIELLSPVER